MKIFINTLFILLISFGNVNNKKDSLKSGFYLVTDSPISTAIKLEESDKIYRLQKEAFIAINNFIAVELTTAYYNKRTNDILNFTLNKEAAAKLSNLSSNGFELKEIGLVLNGKLIQVIKLQGQFKGNKMSLSGVFKKVYLEKLKKQ
jgi:preprotein translocase subunit SecD